MSRIAKRKERSWPTKPLGVLCALIIGRTPSRNRSDFWGGDLPRLSIADMSQGNRITKTKEKITALGAAESRSRLIRSGTVLLSFKLSIGKVAISEIDTYTNEAIVALPIRNSAEISKEYLFWTLRSISLDSEVDSAAKGKTLNSEKLCRIPIPLPTLDEQKRIATVLDKADALRRRRQESLQLAENLIQSAFIDVFGDPVSNPKGLPMLELGKFGIVQTGNTPPRSNKANYAKTGLEWIKTDNIVEDRVVVTPSLERLSETGAKAARVAPAGSLLVACIAGSEKSIGRAALTDRKVAFNQQINSITPHADTSPIFLYFLVKIARRQIQMAAAKGMKKMINKSTFEDLRFIAPEYHDQLRFERVAQRLIEHSKDCQDQLLHLGRFFSSLQQRAFRGELNLSRLELEAEVKSQVVTPAPEPVAIEGRYKRPGYFIAPRKIEEKLLALEAELDGRGDSIGWDEDYFKYRTLSQLLVAPFSFSEIWNQVYNDMPEAHYDDVRGKVFEYVEAGLLEQRFDEKRKEIVLRPRP